MTTAYLILADGTVFKGRSIGAKGKSIGETVFTTGMTGYLETLTDPSYYGQIVTQTFPLIGNYGNIPKDYESKRSWVKGYVVRELCDNPSNFRCESDLDQFLLEQNIIGISGIDTRALTKRLRESGVMNGMIVSASEIETEEFNAEKYLKEIASYKIQDAVEKVSAEGEASPHAPTPSVAPLSAGDSPRNAPDPTVVLWDFGAKANIQRELEKRGCHVKVLPYNTSAEAILALSPDGIMLSNGPGDPAENIRVIEEIKKLCEYDREITGSSPVMTDTVTPAMTDADTPILTDVGNTRTNETGHVIPELRHGNLIPIFGICLGHQMLALARGCKTSKLKYGHRGGNHPVKDTESGRVYITSQNHGYAVEKDSLPSFAKMSFYNVNDETVEGITYTDIPAFSVQFHPEACGGPHDTNFLFDRFLKKMEEVQNASE